jgi:hypothetical protein
MNSATGSGHTLNTMKLRLNVLAVRSFFGFGGSPQTGLCHVLLAIPNNDTQKSLKEVS